ncbi:threonine synthase [Maricaulis sp. MIT060901]|uniref:threonine synthase n=1 Tax=Maricaulis sp. MIT060901 TaxID=3096993 RepID=UPI00399BCF65
MLFHSTRGESPSVPANKALRAGAAPDGGLYLPEGLPQIRSGRAVGSVAEVARELLPSFFTGSALEGQIEQICDDAFNFPVPIVQPGESGPHILELFHGPTGAFKDFGARFLFRSFDRIADASDPITVLAATSGDTGGAVGCAAQGNAHAGAVILFPKGRISPFQEHQLCCWNKPVRALRVDADFDACQALVKRAFLDQDLSRTFGLTSANSISIGRLLPQMSYWAMAARQMLADTGEKPGLVIPTGNLGNAFAAILARALGEPIGPIVLATNANRTLYDWFTDGQYKARASVATLANAMDVGAPSNFERLAAFEPDAPVEVVRVTDNEIEMAIREEHTLHGYVACPHTATALVAHTRISDRVRAERPWLVGATAHPYKFRETVEPLIGQKISPPQTLANVLERPTTVRDIPAELSALQAALAS